jgi:hypothetical protein
VSTALKKLTIAVTVSLALVQAASNFVIQHFAPNLFSDPTQATRFLVTYSVAMLVAAFLSNTLCFREPKHKLLIIDILFTVTCLGAMCLVLLYYHNDYLTIISCTVVFFLRDAFKYLGVVDPELNGAKLFIRFCITGCLAAILAIAILPFALSAVQSVVLLILLGTNLSFTLILSLPRQCVALSTKAVDPTTFSFTVLADVIPIVAGYLILVYTEQLMSPIEYLDFRSTYAFVGLASVVGSLSLVVTSRINFPCSTIYKYFSVVSGAIIATLLTVNPSSLMSLVLLVSATCLSMASSSIARTQLPKLLFFLSSIVAPCGAILFFLFENAPIAKQIIAMVTSVNCLQMFVSHATYLMHENSRLCPNK